ncbi:MAG: SGNH/GDSL hydrolase family protein [Methylobacteriaceae bacterium]|nr:SGNH/GDSL hydrolase family protein [Methylobacteriaceae bacterium]
MPVVVVFGDSNSWGCEPQVFKRFPPGVRWPTVMKRELGADYDLIEEALNGRTTVWDDPIEPHRSGIAYLTPCLLSHAPLDLVIIALGCNDLKKRFSLSPSDIAYGAERLVVAARALPVGPNDSPPKVILMAPPPLARLTDLAEMFEGGDAKSKLLGERYAVIAERQGVPLIDAGKHIRCSDRDGIHFEADQHATLGRVAAQAVRAVLPG